MITLLMSMLTNMTTKGLSRSARVLIAPLILRLQKLVIPNSTALSVLVLLLTVATRIITAGNRPIRCTVTPSGQLIEMLLWTCCAVPLQMTSLAVGLIALSVLISGMLVPKARVSAWVKCVIVEPRSIRLIIGSPSTTWLSYLVSVGACPHTKTKMLTLTVTARNSVYYYVITK